jgi:hypothetical protein
MGPPSAFTHAHARDAQQHHSKTKLGGGLVGSGGSAPLTERGLGAHLVDDVAALRDEHGGGDLAGVAAALTTLRADNVDANVQGLLDVLGCPDHIHHRDAGGMQLLTRGLGRHTDGRDEEGGALLDHDVKQFKQGAASVVVGRLARATAHLRQQQVDPPRQRLVGEAGLDLLALLGELRRGVAEPADDAQTAGVAHSGSELGASSDVHAGQLRGGGVGTGVRVRGQRQTEGQGAVQSLQQQPQGLESGKGRGGLTKIGFLMPKSSVIGVLMASIVVAMSVKGRYRWRNTGRWAALGLLACCRRELTGQ